MLTEGTGSRCTFVHYEMLGSNAEIRQKTLSERCMEAEDADTRKSPQAFACFVEGVVLCFQQAIQLYKVCVAVCLSLPHVGDRF